MAIHITNNTFTNVDTVYKGPGSTEIAFSGNTLSDVRLVFDLTPDLRDRLGIAAATPAEVVAETIRQLSASNAKTDVEIAAVVDASPLAAWIKIGVPSLQAASALAGIFRALLG